MAKENNIKMNKEPTVWENIFANDTFRQGFDLQNIQRTHMTALQEDKQPNLKKGKGLEQTLLQGRHREGPETYEKMLSTPSHQRDAN